MSGIRLLTNSAFDGATLTVTSGAALAKYLNDRDAGPQWVADTVAAQDITVDTQAAGTLPTVNQLAVIHHNLSGLSVRVASSPDGTTFTPALDVLVNADPFTVALTLRTARYWRITIPTPGQPAGAAPARIGELLLGVALQITDNPNLPSGKPSIVGNVARDRSPAGYPWNTRKGNPRRRYEYRWSALPDADLATLQKAYDECDEGSRPLILVDQLGLALWVTWEDAALGPPGALGKLQQEMTATFEEVPQ